MDESERAQDEMIKLLRHVGGEVGIMDEENLIGETPWQILETTRSRWRKQYEKGEGRS